MKNPLLQPKEKVSPNSQGHALFLKEWALIVALGLIQGVMIIISVMHSSV